MTHIPFGMENTPRTRTNLEELKLFLSSKKDLRNGVTKLICFRRS